MSTYRTVNHSSSKTVSAVNGLVILFRSNTLFGNLTYKGKSTFKATIHVRSEDETLGPIYVLLKQVSVVVTIHAFPYV